MAAIGNDTEPVQVLREDVGMRNAEDEQPLEAEILRVRMNPKNSTNREKQEHEYSGHAVYGSWCAACVHGRGVVDNIEVNCGRKRNEKEPLRLSRLTTVS